MAPKLRKKGDTAGDISEQNPAVDPITTEEQEKIIQSLRDEAVKQHKALRVFLMTLSLLGPLVTTVTFRGIQSGHDTLLRPYGLWLLSAYFFILIHHLQEFVERPRLLIWILTDRLAPGVSKRLSLASLALSLFLRCFPSLFFGRGLETANDKGDLLGVIFCGLYVGASCYLDSLDLTPDLEELEKSKYDFKSV
mmetsp:Transcript_24169/g.48068  ORF Transcript_24169/g.48068 Transcript_24169/m.48068 type:complete len:194 (-) Transcript_24169:256-837(-)